MTILSVLTFLLKLRVYHKKIVLFLLHITNQEYIPQKGILGSGKTKISAEVNCLLNIWKFFPL